MRVLYSALLAAVLVVAGSTTAFAAPVSLAKSTIECQLLPEGDTTGAIIIVVAQIPDSATLPALVRLPLPAGATVLWAGEVVGTDVSNDIERTHTVSSANGGKYIEFTLEKSRIAQYEAKLTMPMKDATKVKMALDWVQSVASKDVQFSVRIPTAGEPLKSTPKAEGEPQANEIGESLYTLKKIALKPGEKKTIELEYGTGLAPVEDSGLPTTTILMIVGGALVIAIAALMYVVSRQRGVGASTTVVPGEHEARRSDEDTESYER